MLVVIVFDLNAKAATVAIGETTNMNSTTTDTNDPTDPSVAFCLKCTLICLFCSGGRDNG